VAVQQLVLAAIVEETGLAGRESPDASMGPEPQLLASSAQVI
jgi:hypothetical protein